MKALRSVLTISAVFLLAWPVNAYCGDSAVSGITVIGPSEKASSQTQASYEKSGGATVARMGVSGLDFSPIAVKEDSSEEETPKIEISGSPDNSSSRLMYEISGNKVGATQVSQPVSIPSDGVVMFVDAGVSKSFIIVRVGEGEKETLFLNEPPERAVGARLPKGTYKVYPQDLDGAFAYDKLTAKIQVGLVESKIGGSQ